MFVPKKCEKCGRPAVYKFTRFVNGKPHDRFLCEDHAAENSKWVQKPPGPEAIKAWLKGIVESAGESGAATPKVPDVKCRACGLSFEAYKRTLLLGCAECYRSFEQHLIPELRKFHGEVKHFGRSPRSGLTSPLPAAAPQAAPAPSQAPPSAAEAGPLEEMPEKPPQPAPSPEELRRRLKEAVEREDFEEAARLRDQLRQLERKKAS